MKGKDANGVGSQQPCTVRRNTVYTTAVRLSALLDCQQSNELTPPPDLNGIVRFAEIPNLVSAHVPSCFERAVKATECTLNNTTVL